MARSVYGGNTQLSLPTILMPPPPPPPHHLTAGQVGGYGVFFGEYGDVAEFILVHEHQSNNWGEFRPAL